MSDINPEFLNNSLKIKKIAHFRGRDLYGCFFIIDTIFIPFYEDRGYEIALTHSELTGDDCIVLGRYKTLKEAEIHHRKYLKIGRAHV